MERDAAQRWLREYASAWERADENAADLFADGATYRSHVFREPHVGHEGIRAYWRGATSTQRDARVLIGDALVGGDRVVAEWWTTMTEEDGPVTLPGVLLLDFEGDKCSALREYWTHERGLHEPFDGWGRFGAGDDDERARKWAGDYLRAWTNDDADAAAAAYSEDVLFRSHPFRAPDRGRAAVREHTARAFASEEDRTVRFGRPLAAGSSAAVEYWATYLEDGAPRTLAGCVLLTLDEHGVARSSRDYWHEGEGRLDPPPGWGWT